MPDPRAFLQETFEKSGGELSFEDFMATALYDPVFGYYTAGIAGIGGGRGDFATSATLSEAMGRAIARWAMAEIRRRRWKGKVSLVEVGGGNGALAAAVLKSLGWRGRGRVRYQLVEISPTLRKTQRKALSRYRVDWHEEIEGALSVSQGRALLFANELVDAFPAKWLRWSADRHAWQEIFVAYSRDSGLREVFRDCPEHLGLAAYGATELSPRSDGQRIEILPSFRRWMEKLAHHWREGAMLLIDYGGPSAEAVYRRRPQGTMRGYFRHERIEGSGVYARIGKQDLTADVNFADLSRWAEELEFETEEIATQRKFLERFGETGDTMAGSGAGDSFQVLECMV